MKHTIKTIPVLEENFWENFPDLPQPHNSQAIRQNRFIWEKWIKFVYHMARDGQIPDMLAWKAAPEPTEQMKLNDTPAGTPATPIKPIPAPVPRKRDPRDARNYYRRKAGIPLNAPKHSRAEPFNRPRRGTGNIKKFVYLPQSVWERLDEARGTQTRGEFIQSLLP